MSEHTHPVFVPGCPVCVQEAADAGFRGQTAAGGTAMQTPAYVFDLIEALSTGQPLDFQGHPVPADVQARVAELEAAPVRVTESVDAPEAEAATEAGETAEEGAEQATEAGKTTPKAPYGVDTEYADPGYQADKKKRYPVDTAAHVRSAWSYVNQRKNASQYSAAQLAAVKKRIKAAAKKLGVEISSTTEAQIDGQRSFSDVQELVRDAIVDRAKQETGKLYLWGYIADMTADQVVYCVSSDDDDLWQCSWAVDDGGTVTLGEPTMVVRTYRPASPAEVAAGQAEDDDEPGEGAAPMMEARPATDRIVGRVIEAKGTDETGGRVFGVRIIAYGDSKNARRYPEAVLKAAIPLYEGAKAYDHHRTDEELKSSTITGLVGYYRDVAATAEGLEADLHLLPGARHTAEALDATLDAQDQGLPLLVGVSHDVLATYKPIVAEGGRQLQEATSIVKVYSADVVADPAAGGQAIRMVAGGTDPAGEPTDPAGAGPAASKEATVPDAPAAPAPAAPNYTLEQVLALLRSASPQQLAEATGLSTLTTKAGAQPADNNPVVARKDGFFGRMMVEQKILDAGLPLPTAEAVWKALPDRITEADVDAHIVAIKASLGVLERANLAPKAGVKVTKESLDKKTAALDAFFAGDHAKGYHSIKQAYADFTGLKPNEDTFGADWNRRILQESMGSGFDSATRSFESLDSTSWNLVLGDSITRRMVAEYSQPNLQTWRQIVSSLVPVNDFRQQRIDRVGGYGVLPGVNQGAPYQPLTSPPNEEVTYTVSKRGGTEDITLEMIANDDVRAIQRIPTKLGLAAAQTLYRFIWDILNPGTAAAGSPASNPLIYDGVALYAAGHANTATSALSASAVSTVRQKMRSQAAYGDAFDVLSYIPRTLVVVNTLEELAFELVTSAVALPSGAPVGGATNIPNIHQGTQLIVIDYWPSTTGWLVVADTGLCPTLEIGFYQGRDVPELFTQSDPNFGTVFNADKISYKIRHIYSGAVLDYRGFQRGNV